jgi:hypothetical protein
MRLTKKAVYEFSLSSGIVGKMAQNRPVNVRDFTVIISVPNNSCRFVFKETAQFKKSAKTRNYTS